LPLNLFPLIGAPYFYRFPFHLKRQKGMHKDPPDIREEIMTVGQAAKILGVGPKTLSAMVRHGKVPGFRLGDKGYWRIKRSDIESLMATHKPRKSKARPETL
jgi:excisionase family DNA binding protein